MLIAVVLQFLVGIIANWVYVKELKLSYHYIRKPHYSQYTHIRMTTQCSLLGQDAFEPVSSEGRPHGGP